MTKKVYIFKRKLSFAKRIYPFNYCYHYHNYHWYVIIIIIINIIITLINSNYERHKHNRSKYCKTTMCIEGLEVKWHTNDIAIDGIWTISLWKLRYLMVADLHNAILLGIDFVFSSHYLILRSLWQIRKITTVRWDFGTHCASVYLRLTVIPLSNSNNLILLSLSSLCQV